MIVKVLLILLLLNVKLTLGDESLIITDLTQDNFTSALNRNYVVLVSFYAPWCGYCKTLQSELVAVASLLKKDNIDARIATVDAVAERDLSKNEKIHAFPTLLLYRNGKYLTLYKGNRVASDIYKFMVEKSGAVAHTITNLEEFKDQISDIAQMIKDYHDPGLAFASIGIFPKTANLGGINGINAQKYLKSASAFNDLDFFITESDELIDHYHTNPDECTVITLALGEENGEEYKLDKLSHLQQINFNGKESNNQFESNSGKDEVFINESGRMLMEADTTIDQIRSMLTAYSFPVIILFDKETSTVIDKLPVREHVLLFVNTEAWNFYLEKDTPMKTDDDKKNNKNNKNDKNKKEEDISVKLSMKLLEEVEMKCDSYRGRLVFIVIPASERSVIQHFGHENSPLPQITVADIRNPENPNRYSMHSGRIQDIFGGGYETSAHTQSIEPSFLNRFLDQYINNELSPSLRTEAIDKSTVITANDPSSSANDNNIDGDGDGVVQTIVGSQFEEYVMRSEEDVLLMLLAPWCGHCKSLEPVYSDAAAAVAGIQESTKVNFYRLDHSKNEIAHPNVIISGYPTLYLFPKGMKDQPILFQGERSSQGITDFVTKAINVQDIVEVEEEL